MPSIIKRWIAKRIRKDIASLEWYERQLQKAAEATRLLAQQKRVKLADWE